MRCAFFHDHRLFVRDGHVYSNWGFPSNVWDRYLRFFDELIVFGRQTDNQIEGVLSEREGVSFNLFPESTFITSFVFRKKDLIDSIEKMLGSVDCAIIRLPSLSGYIAAEKCRKYSMPYAIEVVGCQWDSYWNYGDIKAKLIAGPLCLKMKKEVRLATHAIYVTRYFLKKRYPSHGYIANASNVMLHELSDSILEKRIELINSPKQNLTIGLLAHYNVKYKGFDVIIKALAKLKKKGYFVNAVVAGSGTSNHLKKLARDHGVGEQTAFIGLLKSNEVIKFLDDIDIYVHPSKQEGLPRSVIEALSRACPVLASSVAGIPELVDRDYLHKPGDYKTLARHLQQIIQGKFDLTSMARTNFERAKDYSIEKLDNERNAFWKHFYEYTKSNVSTGNQ